MKIALFGEDNFTVAALISLIGAGHEITMIVCPLRLNNNGSKPLKAAAAKHQIPFLHESDINSATIASAIAVSQPDILLSVHCRKIIERRIFSIPRLGGINVHPSLLPKYRGLSPQHQALIHGDSQTGVTVHRIDDGVDTGDIIISETIDLQTDTTIYDLLCMMLPVYKRIVGKALDLIGDPTFTPSPQSGDNASSFGPLTRNDRKIDPKKTTFENYNLIRAVSKPYQGAWYENYLVWSANGQPTEDVLIIPTSDGQLLSDDFEIEPTQ